MPAIIKKGRVDYTRLKFSERSPSAKEESDGSGDSFDAFSEIVASSKGEEKASPKLSSDDEKKEMFSSDVELKESQVLEELAAEKVEQMIREASVNADNIIAAAEKDVADLKVEADEILLRAEKEAEKKTALAYEEGFEQGRKDGEEFGRKELEAKARNLERLFEEISSKGEALVALHERQIVNLVLEVARNIINREIEIAPEIIYNNIKAAMKMVVSGSSVKIHLNPVDFEYLEDDMTGLAAVQGGIKIELVNDAGIERGGCLLESNFGFIDATIGGKWQAVSDEIRRVLDEKKGKLLPENREGEEFIVGSENSMPVDENEFSEIQDSSSLEPEK